ncbi:MAG: 23S rRNA (adenine(2030)-N(6))-methyltransferase RlmJ, partial [Hyphomicrobium sp.]
MNYRHAYHAGNFADVMKHAVLALIIEYMKIKPQPFRVIDVHAGLARYDLAGIEAGKTCEWQSGIARLLTAQIPDDAAALLAPYLNAVRAMNDDQGVHTYPGSPLLARMLMRSCDT